MSHILNVTDLTRALKDVLEAEFPFVWVRGQVTNLARPASGHLYFTLSDAEAQLSVVWFRGSQGRGGRPGPGGEKVDPLTGEVLEAGTDAATSLADGQEVLAAGRISVYAPRGNYQLIAELVQPAGISGLAAAFEALKRKLADKGLFDEARKRPVPPSPARVALITSAQGAAVRDFLRLAETRGTGAQIRIYPALVQGDAAPGQIAAQLDAVNRDGWAEVVALIRGGGSLEDLWAFNTEPVAEAMARSAIPVVTGVGHEPDVSIADYVADRRFPTPSAVAVGLWPLRADLMQAVDGLEAQLARAVAGHLDRAEAKVAELSRALAWLSPAQRLERLEQGWREASRRLLGAGGRYLDQRGREAALALRGLVRAFGPQAVDQRAELLRALSERLALAADLRLADASRRAELLAARLAGLDPEAPLARGYSLVHVLGPGGAPGPLLRSAGQVRAGDGLRVRTGRGELDAQVTGASGAAERATGDRSTGDRSTGDKATGDKSTGARDGDQG